MFAIVIAVAAAHVATACDKGAPPKESLSSTTDSAGVAIVRGPAADVPLPWRFVELKRIGGADSGAQAFDDITVYRVRTNGESTIAVLDTRNNAIHLFDSLGATVRAVGAKGSGPGETQWPQRIDLARDGAVMVYDVAKQAVVRWSATGAVEPERKLSSSTGRVWGAPLLRGDTVWAAVDVIKPSDSATTVRRLERWTPSDTVVLDSTVNAKPKMVMFKCVGLALPPLFTGELAWALGDGRVATTHQSAYIVDLVELSPNGRKITSVRRDIVPANASAADANKLYPEGLKVRFGAGGQCVTPSAEVGEKVGVAATLPLVRDMAFAPDGSLWVQRYTFEGETPAVDVFDPRGQYLGTARGTSLPLGFLGTDRVLLPIKNDDDGTSIIGIYRIDRSVARP
jgi:hypothetical protein